MKKRIAVILLLFVLASPAVTYAQPLVKYGRHWYPYRTYRTYRHAPTLQRVNYIAEGMGAGAALFEQAFSQVTANQVGGSHHVMDVLTEKIFQEISEGGGEILDRSYIFASDDSPSVVIATPGRPPFFHKLVLARANGTVRFVTNYVTARRTYARTIAKITARAVKEGLRLVTTSELMEKVR